MSRKINRVGIHLDTKGIKHLPSDEIRAILRGADELIMRGGRNLLAKILKGSKDKKILQLGLDKCPVYGFYQKLTIEEITAKIDWLIVQGYFAIEYDNRLPLIVYTEKGWELEKDSIPTSYLKNSETFLKVIILPLFQN